MKIKSYLLLFLLFLYAFPLLSQKSDFGLWYEVNAVKRVSKKFDLEGTVMVRTFDNASLIDQAYMELAASYDLNKYLGFAVSYRIGNYVDNDQLYHIRHKLFADIKGSLPVGNFSFSARLRLQFLARTYVDHESDPYDEYDGRVKLKASYNIKKFPLDPYVYFESFSPLFRNSDYPLEKSRSAAGLEYKITKKHILEAEYIYQRDNTPHLSIMHIVSFSYTFRF